MAYSSNEVDFLARNRAAIATSAESLELTKASTMADMDSLRKEYGEYSRAVAELTSARRAGVRTHKFPGLAESATEFLV
ncbi:MAG: SAM-dependent methyltransferase, partial [Corynebacterium casei]|nr:SAM-dependent methyltransferase [Corynebacterium casei]